MAVPLWDLSLFEVEVPIRVTNRARSLGLSKAWHLAVVCDACFLRWRNMGPKSLKATRVTLARHGFPAAQHDCGSRGWVALPGGREFPAGRMGWQSVCERDLQVCRDMLEPGQG
jgi:hypothetical protein